MRQQIHATLKRESRIGEKTAVKTDGEQNMQENQAVCRQEEKWSVNTRICDKKKVQGRELANIHLWTDHDHVIQTVVPPLWKEWKWVCIYEGQKDWTLYFMSSMWGAIGALKFNHGC